MFRTPNTRTLIGIAFALLAVIGVLAWVVFAYVPPNTIILRNDGWHPSTLTAAMGTTVTFKNETDKYFWPASDFHPTHTLYPAFDAKAPLKPGSSWSFTFTEAGTYPFHDHLAAYFTGFVRIHDAEGAVPDNCMERGGEFLCWQNKIFLALAEKGLDAAYDVVTSLYESDPDFAASCHSIAHNIGLASYQLYLKDPSLVLSAKAVACGAGFYHGFMEGFLGASTDPKKAAAICDKIGKALDAESPDARLQCFHGIGHGAMETAVATTGVFTTIDDMMEGAVATCEKASSGVDERYRCVSGAYNALANLYIAKAYGLDAKKEDPFALCSRQKEAYKEACYGDMNSLAMWLAGNNFIKATAYVTSIPDVAERPKAVEYLAGLNAVPHLHDTSFASVVADCHRIAPMYDESCILGFAHGLLEHGSPGTEYVQAVAFCGEPALSASERASCYTGTLGGLAGWYSADKSAQICAAQPAALQSYCRSSSQK